MRKQDLFRLTALAVVLTAAFVIIALRLRPVPPQVSVPTLMSLPTAAPAVAELPTESQAATPTNTATDTAANTPTYTQTHTTSPTYTTSSTYTSTATRASAPVPALPPAVPSTALPDVTLPNTAAQLVAPPVQPVENQVVITFSQDTSAQEQAAYIESIGGEITRSIESLNTVVVEVPDTLTDLPASAVVEDVEPDHYVTALFDVPPDDSYYSQQWALPAMNVPNAWLSLPDNAPVVVVAVIDSGVCADHPDLADKVLPGWDYVEDDSTPQDDFGHGCGVAGIIAASSNNGIGIAGIAPNARILPLRVLDHGGVGTYSNVAAAIVSATDLGAQVINLSLGGSVPSAILEDAVSYAASRGVIVVAAAGNTGQPGVLYPAAYDAVIAVASVSSSLQASSFNSTGPEVDTFAPGQSVLSLLISGAYGTMSGTSFAAPQVAGIAALELARGHSLTFDGSLITASGVPQPTTTPATPSPVPQLPSTDEFPVSKPNVATLSSVLDDLLRGYRENAAQALQEGDLRGLQVEADRVHVNLIMLDTASATAALAALPALGGEVTAQYDIWIDAWVPILQLEAVAQLPGVTLLQPVVPVFPVDSPAQQGENVLPQEGSLTSQGVTWSNASEWHDANLTGSGIKIGIVDVGFLNYPAAQANGNLPAEILCYTSPAAAPTTENCPLLNGGNIHGTGVAEIVHDMAPNAQLAFAVPNSPTQMGQYITAMAAAGYRVITSSMSYVPIGGSADLNDGTGPVAQAINAAYSSGTVYVQAAGNSALTHWEGPFTSVDGDISHEFGAGSNSNSNTVPHNAEVNQIGTGALPQGTGIIISLRWNGWPTTNQDYDLYLMRYDTVAQRWVYVCSVVAGVESCGTTIGSKTRQAAGGVAPLEWFQYSVPALYANQQFGVVINRYSATGTEVLDLHAFVNRDLENSTAARSLVDPATASGALAVAAVTSTNGGASFTRQSYSSVGPAHPPDNTWWPLPGSGYPQPRIAGYDGVANYSYGTFGGTSAAAPHVAGAAALVLQRFPEYSAAQVRQFLESRALDMNAPGYDVETGTGRLWLAAPNVGFEDFQFGSSCNSTPSGEKPQSKLWWTDGSWWGVLCSADSSYHIYRLNWGSQTWIDTGVAIDNRTGTKVDVLWDSSAQKLYVLSHIFSNSGSSGSQEARLYRYSYNSASDSYSLDANFPVVAASGEWPNVVLAKDSTGQLWITMVQGRRVVVNRTSGSDTSWGTPFEIPTAASTPNTNTDDISSIIAFNGQIGVIWSNQSNNTVYFAIHNDSAGDTTWQPLEIVAQSSNIADDHFNMQVDASGRLFVASKTSLTGSNPLVVMYRRLVNGTWNSFPFGTAVDSHTRPILVLDESNNRVYLFATSGQSGGTIYYKSTSMDAPSFPVGIGEFFISYTGALRLNNAASTDQNVNGTTELVVIATDQDTRRYYHNYILLDGTAPTPSHTPTFTPTRTLTPRPGLNAPNSMGIYIPSTALWLLRNTLTTGLADSRLVYGGIADGLPVVGDWNGDGVDTVGMYVPATAYWFMRNSNTTGYGEIFLVYGGIPGALPVVGDWNGDGIDTVGLYNPSNGTWLLRNSNTTGLAEITFTFTGPVDALPVVGDWNGDGIDTVGLYTPSTALWRLRNSNTTGPADIQLVYGGIAGGLPVAGDWNGDGVDTVGMYVPATAYWFMRNSNTTGYGEIFFVYGGISGSLPIAGRWTNAGANALPGAIELSSATPTATPTVSTTATPSATQTSTVTASSTSTPTPTVSTTATLSATQTATVTANATVSWTPIASPIAESTTTTTATDLSSATSTSTQTTTPTTTSIATETATAIPTTTPTPTLITLPTATNVPTSTLSPTETALPVPSEVPSPEITQTVDEISTVERELDG